MQCFTWINAQDFHRMGRENLLKTCSYKQQWIDFCILRNQLLAIAWVTSSTIKWSHCLHDPSFGSNVYARQIGSVPQEIRQSCSQAPGTSVGALAPRRDWIALFSKSIIRVGTWRIAMVSHAATRTIVIRMMCLKLSMTIRNIFLLFVFG